MGMQWRLDTCRTDGPRLGRWQGWELSSSGHKGAKQAGLSPSVACVETHSFLCQREAVPG